MAQKRNISDDPDISFTLPGLYGLGYSRLNREQASQSSGSHTPVDLSEDDIFATSRGDTVRRQLLVDSQLGNLFYWEEREEVNRNSEAVSRDRPSDYLDISVREGTVIRNRIMEYLATAAAADKKLPVFLGLSSDDGSHWMLEFELATMTQDRRCHVFGTK